MSSSVGQTLANQQQKIQLFVVLVFVLHGILADCI